MKKLILFALLGIGSLAAMPAKAQVSLDVHVGPQPQRVVYYAPPRPVIVHRSNTYVVRHEPTHYIRRNHYYRPNVVVVGHENHYRGHDHRDRSHHNGHGRGGRH